MAGVAGAVGKDVIVTLGFGVEVMLATWGGVGVDVSCWISVCAGYALFPWVGAEQAARRMVNKIVPIWIFILGYYL